MRNSGVFVLEVKFMNMLRRLLSYARDVLWSTAPTESAERVGKFICTRVFKLS